MALVLEFGVGAWEPEVTARKGAASVGHGAWTKRTQRRHTPAFCDHLAQCMSSSVLRTLVGHFVSLEILWPVSRKVFFFFPVSCLALFFSFFLPFLFGCLAA